MLGGQLGEDRAVVAGRIDVDHVTPEDQPEDLLQGVLVEQVGDLHDVVHEREGAHLGEQVLQRAGPRAA